MDGDVLLDERGANHAIAVDPHVLPEPRPREGGASALEQEPPGRVKRRRRRRFPHGFKRLGPHQPRSVAARGFGLVEDVGAGSAPAHEGENTHGPVVRAA